MIRWKIFKREIVENKIFMDINEMKFFHDNNLNNFIIGINVNDIHYDIRNFTQYLYQLEN
jgi:hypothetical protein